MRNIKLTLAYDGTDFHGWQVQPGQSTLQGHLNDVLRRITQENIFVHGAGRTDAGVHALGQVGHFQTQSRLTLEEFQHALNSLLPPSIRVLAVQEVALDFHARHHAAGKTYRYRIFRGPVIPPFLCRYVLHFPGPLDEDAMMAAARLFEGEHNFTTFCAASDIWEGDEPKEPNPLRIILESRILRCHSYSPPGNSGNPLPESSADYELVYRVRGRSFLRYMVRKIVGTLLEVGRGRLQPSDIPALLAMRDRAKSGPTLPPHGLFLEAVEYPPCD